MILLSGNISEKEMSDAFCQLLSNNGIKEFPIFTDVFKEVSCQQGIADFIAICAEDKNQIQNIYNSIMECSNVSLDSVALIMSFLKTRSPRTEEFLVASSGLKQTTVKRVLGVLLSAGAIEKTQTGSFLVGQNWVEPKMEIWAFELKLENWKRAIFQAMQYRAFAHRVFVVLPKNKHKILTENLETFKKLKIGIMTFNYVDGSYELIFRPTKSLPASKRHNIYALGKMALNQGNQECTAAQQIISKVT